MEAATPGYSVILLLFCMSRLVKPAPLSIKRMRIESTRVFMRMRIAPLHCDQAHTVRHLADAEKNRPPFHRGSVIFIANQVHIRRDVGDGELIAEPAHGGMKAEIIEHLDGLITSAKARWIVLISRRETTEACSTFLHAAEDRALVGQPADIHIDHRKLRQFFVQFVGDMLLILFNDLLEMRGGLLYLLYSSSTCFSTSLRRVMSLAMASTYSFRAGIPMSTPATTSFRLWSHSG